MEEKEIDKKIDEFKNDLNDLSNKLDILNKKSRSIELDNIINSPNFWSGNTKDVLEENKILKSIINKYDEINDSVNTLSEMVELGLEVDNIDSEISNIEKKIDELKLSTFLSGEYDSNNAYIEIHSGAGGTESNDWANMLYRMYTRFFEKNDYKYEVISKNDGEEVGIKGVVLLVKGYYPFGYLKGETGVHRLVRISPFDSNKRRHTSFASVLVTPEISKNLDVEIKDSDLKVDVYRSSGAGGQGVNTTDSAVRITHIPSGIVVTCQNERSQIRNKETAISVLKNKLYKLELEKREKELNSIKGDNMEINFGSQIRSYILHPYSLVKDHRTNTEVSDSARVLDGDIDIFIYNNLRKNIK